MNYLEVIQDDSEEKQHVVQLIQERSHSFFIDGSVAQTERQPPSSNAEDKSSQAQMSQRVRYPQESSSKDLLMGKSSAGQESSDLTQPPSFGERYIFKRNQEDFIYATDGTQDIPSSLD